MLTLKDNQSKCEHKPPKFIHLSLGHNLIGRSYQADVKLFKYPWLSRKHLSITKVDDSHYLEVLGRSSVFVNRKSVNFSSLSEGDQIIIGGAGKNYPVASHFPECPGPYLEYTYSYTVHTTGKENCYKDPAISPEEVISLEESRDGRMIQEKYHLQDFENTQDSFEIERQLLAASPGLQPNMPPKTARGKKAKREAKKCPVQPLVELDSEDAATSRAVVTPSKRVKKRGVKKSATVSRPQDVDADSRDEAWQQYDRVLDIANRTLDLLDEREKEEAAAGTSSSGAGHGPSTSSSAAPLTESNRPSSTVGSTRPKRLHKLLKYTFSDEDFSDGVTPKKQKVSHNEDKDLELPDLDAPSAVSDLLAIEPWRKKKGSKKKKVPTATLR